MYSFTIYNIIESIKITKRYLQIDRDFYLLTVAVKSLQKL